MKRGSMNNTFKKKRHNSRKACQDDVICMSSPILFLYLSSLYTSLRNGRRTLQWQVEWQLGMRVGWKVYAIRSGTLGDNTSDQGLITI